MQVLNPNLCNGIIVLLASTLVAAAAHAATYTCVTNALRGNKWICQDNADLCTFVFIVNEKEKTMVRRVNDNNPRVPVVVDKWEDKKIIAHEDQTRLDERFIEQYYYRIERDTGNFVMANEYRTNSGRYLTQDDINATDKKRFSYYRPRLFSETGQCKFSSGK
ncbi:MAG: hypothetical protein FJY60_01015 [Betaproteobacteria bacterium]|nr:hypothetical protein [Betaproteobacteria bacterium]